MSVSDRQVRKDFSVEKTFELRSEEADVFKSWGIALAKDLRQGSTWIL